MYQLEGMWKSASWVDLVELYFQFQATSIFMATIHLRHLNSLYMYVILVMLPGVYLFTSRNYGNKDPTESNDHCNVFLTRS